MNKEQCIHDITNPLTVVDGLLKSLNKKINDLSKEEVSERVAEAREYLTKAFQVLENYKSEN